MFFLFVWVILGLKWWFSRVYTAYILHLAFFGVEFWNIREYTKKQSNNLNKCHGKELQRIFECMFFPVKHCQMSICQRKHFHLTGFHFHFPASQMAWRFHKNTCHSVEKLGAFFWLWKKLCIVATIWRYTYFSLKPWFMGGIGYRAEGCHWKLSRFAKPQKNFHSPPGIFLKAHLYPMFFFPFRCCTNISNTPSRFLRPKSPEWSG